MKQILMIATGGTIASILAIITALTYMNNRKVEYHRLQKQRYWFKTAYYL